MTPEQYVIKCADDLACAVSHHRELEHLMFDCPPDAIDLALANLQLALVTYRKGLCFTKNKPSSPL